LGLKLEEAVRKGSLFFWRPADGFLNSVRQLHLDPWHGELMLRREIADRPGMTMLASQGPSGVTTPITAPERRVEDRLQVCVPVRVTYVSGTRTSLEGTCTNVSTTGAAFELNAVLQVGDIIDFEFRNTNDVPVTYRARILYRDGTHYGSYFLTAY
jgi:hypothetical protein